MVGTAADTLTKLDGRRFPAAAAMDVAFINSNTLTNWLAKTPLVLCSDAEGRGRARAFCLIDIYQIALLASLVRITGRVEWSVRALNGFLFFPVEERSLADWLKSELTPPGATFEEYWATKKFRSGDEEIQEYKDKACFTVDNAPEIYRHRDSKNPWFFYVAELSLMRDLPVLDEIRADVLSRFSGSSDLNLRFGGVVINVTAMLSGVDRALLAYLPKSES